MHNIIIRSNANFIIAFNFGMKYINGKEVFIPSSPPNAAVLDCKHFVLCLVEMYNVYCMLLIFVYLKWLSRFM